MWVELWPNKVAAMWCVPQIIGSYCEAPAITSCCYSWTSPTSPPGQVGAELLCLALRQVPRILER